MMKWSNEPAGRARPDPAKGPAAPGSDGGKAGGPPRGPPRRAWWIFLVILLLNYLVMRSLFPDAGAATVPYTVFKEQVAKGNVRAIYSQGVSIEGRFITPVPWPPPGHEGAGPQASAPWARSRAPEPAETFTTTLPAFVDPGLEDFLIAHKVEISAVPIRTGGGLWGRCCWASARRC